MSNSSEKSVFGLPSMLLGLKKEYCVDMQGCHSTDWILLILFSTVVSSVYPSSIYPLSIIYLSAHLSIHPSIDPSRSMFILSIRLLTRFPYRVAGAERRCIAGNWQEGGCVHWEKLRFTRRIMHTPPPRGRTVICRMLYTHIVSHPTQPSPLPPLVSTFLHLSFSLSYALYHYCFSPVSLSSPENVLSSLAWSECL